MISSVKITYDQYQEMIRLGLFLPREEHHVELIHGEIVPIRGDSPMSPIDPDHLEAVDALIIWSFEILPTTAIRVSVQSSISIPHAESEPEPDFVWLIPKNYKGIKRQASDVLLLIEVSDSSLSKDRNAKAQLYAEAGIRDYWIVDINNEKIEVRRDPVDGSYLSLIIYGIGEEVRPLAFPDVMLPVARLFPD